MPLTDTCKNRALNQIAGNSATSAAITHGSLHNGYPSTTGANEISGGSPAYGRKALTFEAVAGTETPGSLDITNAPVFDIPAGTNVAWVGFWTAVTAGTFMGWAPAGGAAYIPFFVDDIATDVFDAKAHGFSNGNNVVVWGGANLPTGVSEGTTYFVVSASTDTLQLSLTSGGAAVNITVIGSGFLQKQLIEAFASQGTYTLTDADIALV